MALAPSNLTSGTSAGGSASFTTASISPTSGDLIIVSVGIVSVTPSNSKIGPPSISGAGLTFNLLSKQDSSATTKSHWVFWAVAGAGATAGALTIGWSPTGPGLNINWVVDKITGQDSSSTIAWCVQAVQSFSSSSATAPSATLQTLQDTSSVTYASVECTWTAAQISPGTGFTQLAEQSGPNHVLATMYKVNDPVATWAITTGTQMYAVTALEITASNSGARNNPLANHFLGCSGAGA